MYQIVWRGESIGFVAKEKYKREIACLEPFLEAAPQVWAWSWPLVMDVENHFSLSGFSQNCHSGPEETHWG